jgi:hypothetical protein
MIFDVESTSWRLDTYDGGYGGAFSPLAVCKLTRKPSTSGDFDLEGGRSVGTTIRR